MTGEPFSFSNWANGEPNDWADNEDALQFTYSEGSWNDIAMAATVPGYIVEYSVNMNPGCDRTAVNPDNGHVYQSVSVPEGVTWDEGYALAQNMGGYLATLTSSQENQFVFDAFP